MSSGMPELGSKISLISKADIRYEGELYTVDPIECTIALSNVRSFGTEEREAKCPVPAQAQIYDFILFRGSDIKDIRVVQGQPMPPNDPAIVQHQISHPPPSAAPGYPSVVQPSHSHTFSHHMGAAPGSHLMGGSLGGQHHVHPSVSAGGYNPMSGSVLDLIGSLSRSSTPAPRKSPSLDHLANSAAAAAGGQQQRLGMGQRAVQRPQSRQSRSRERLYNNHHSSHAGSAGDPLSAPSQQQQQPTLTYRDRNDFYDRNEMRHEYANHRSEHNYRSGGDNRRGDNNRGDNRDRVYNNYRSGGRGGGGSRVEGGWGGQNSQPHHQVRSGSGGRRPRPRSRGPGFGASGAGGGGGGYHSGGGGGGKGGPRGSGGQTGNTLKFESDYDFDKANSEFNEMLSKLNETKLDDGGAPVVVNGTAPPPEGDKKDDGEANDHEGDADEDKFYDKTKSFFDNISCEAVERSRGAFQRTDWRQERKMNSETFGVAATRRGGGYRGRGGGFYYGGGGRGYHRNHYNNQGRNTRGGYGPRLGGGNPRHGGGYGGGAGGSGATSGGKEASSSSGGGSGSVVKTAAQVVASGNAAPAVAAEAK